ncbi:MAG: hypothetical protein JWN86_3028 [Planctomycetota bacterium]|nr:hypothetical protein [Planctomycetota bacterium]
MINNPIATNIRGINAPTIPSPLWTRADCMTVSVKNKKGAVHAVHTSPRIAVPQNLRAKRYGRG